ncbi:flavodoxin family protein [Candidatus Mycosynbacter amalyticus]|uniref:Flavodoxin family protein n=1 Tax=Candidatus Mycosynbacter amalyticus TaxID=2665156 RepID=A0A857MM26_9BACT|nr:flavodoxin family protein [Candidatus Mycosynbacter amalyticus]QHN42642.1 flavodoxin family protein [Candidatus Mycosynbacter amalyticus]
MADTQSDFTGLKALFFNGTLKRSPEVSNTEGLLRASVNLMQKLGASAEIIRTIDHDIATGVQPDMREHGWKTDEWPQLFEKVKAADIVVVCGPIWLGDNSSQTKKLIERLYANSADTNGKGQYIYYGKVGGCIITGNEDGIKHCAMNVLYSLQHVGFTIPPQADAGWIGPVGPGPSYLDKGSGGPESDFTNRNITFMTYNLLHTAQRLRKAGGIPAEGNVPAAWNDGEQYGFANPEYRSPSK